MAFVMQNTILARQIILSVEEFVAKNSISAGQFFFYIWRNISVFHL